MTKADLVERVSRETGLTRKDTGSIVKSFLTALADSLARGQNVELRRFGTFKVRQRKARMARNPRTGEPVEVPERFVPVFRASKELKAKVNR
jgi:integration host factor subunit beta